MRKFTGRPDIRPETAATPILRELLETTETGDVLTQHPASKFRKLMFDTVADPFRSPEEKWKWLTTAQEPVHGTISGRHEEYTLTPDTQKQAFLLSALALFAEHPNFRTHPDVISKIQSVWSDYAESSETGDHRPRSGSPYAQWKRSEQQTQQAREELPKFLSISRRLLDIIKVPQAGSGADMFSYWAQWIPELKDLKA